MINAVEEAKFVAPHRQYGQKDEEGVYALHLIRHSCTEALSTYTLAHSRLFSVGSGRQCRTVHVSYASDAKAASQAIGLSVCSSAQLLVQATSRARVACLLHLQHLDATIGHQLHASD